MMGGPQMPTTDIGEVGPLLTSQRVSATNPPVPALPQAGPALAPPSMGDLSSQDAAMFGEPSPQLPQAPRLPPPVSAQPSSGGLPVQPSGEASAPASASQPQALPEQTALTDFRAQKRQQLLNLARTLTERGGPASQVRASQLLFEVQKDLEAEKAEKLHQSYIQNSTADEEDKARAATLQGLGAAPKDVAEALRFNNEGAKARLERREQFVKWGQAVQNSERDQGTLEVNAERAIKILDEGNLTTGLGGAMASYIPGSAHNKLEAALAPLKVLTGYDYLQQMRDQSKTGGAVGNVTENETKWLMGIQGSLDTVNNDPDIIKENIRTIVRGKQIVTEMKRLVPALDAGDPSAWDKYAKLTRELGKNGATVKAQMKPDFRQVVPDNNAVEQKYGVE